MEYFMVPTQKVPSLQHFRKTEKEVIGGLCSLANIPLTPETQRDQERRIRREIANSNERRRMQSINAGFQSLKTLIPHTDGEKLSKAAILQQTAEYIFSLEQEKTRLLQQNTQLKRFIQELSGSSPKRRRAEDKDEGIGSPDIWEDEKAEDLRREMIELRQQLDKERSVRMMLEEQCCAVPPAGALSGGPHVPGKTQGDCPAGAAATAAGAGAAAAPGEAGAGTAAPADPAPASSSPHPPPHRDCACTSPAFLPPHQCCHYGSFLSHQLCLYIPAKSGHHRAGHPAH
ncbi:transcription factor AP-4 isoform X1 [Rattus norvegicus]|uniref:transcription factor AP-4 isoform X1 n=1 Tax=Rattus norvegicus TaxID=10116 RepID=UPI0019179E7B|nr:transcription factor AP-4 isoform X1 [Rattus norvegicus]